MKENIVHAEIVCDGIYTYDLLDAWSTFRQNPFIHSQIGISIFGDDSIEK